MLDKLRVHGFRTLFNTDISFSPLTIMLGKNGVGKTTILDVIQLLGKFARGGVQRAFGPPPWSLSWQRTKGIGNVTTTDFELQVTAPPDRRYLYSLKLAEREHEAVVEEERLLRHPDNTVLAHLEWKRPPVSGTILRPDPHTPPNAEIQAVSSIFTSFESYELNPAYIERGNDPKTTFVMRNGSGVAGYLANLKDNDPDRFSKLESYLKKFRPETQSIEVWAPSDAVFWGLLDKGQRYPFSAVHLSWGDRQLVGLLCVLFSAPHQGTIAVEEIDRGFHPSRYGQVIDLLKEAVYDGLMNNETVQVIVTTHSPSFVNKLTDTMSDIRLVTRLHNGGTVVRPLEDVMRTKFGSAEIDAPLGEIWEMELFEETINEAIS